MNILRIFILKNLSLKKEIMLILIFKVILLYGIWFICFSAPKDHHLPAATALHVFNLPMESFYDRR